MTAATVQAYAKINLFLAIRGRRSDGYHELDMVNAEAALADRLTFLDRAEPGIDVICDHPQIPTGRENLVWQSAALLIGEDPVPGLSVHLEKNIPVGAGLGGGSSDAAATLRMVNRLRGCRQDDRLLELAARLGSDVPYSLVGGLCRCRGRGERVERLSDAASSPPWLYVLLIIPPLSVYTGRAYEWWEMDGKPDDASPDRLIEATEARDPHRLAEELHNSFDTVVPRHVPAIAQIMGLVEKQTGRSPHLAGSGASMFLTGSSPDLLAELRDRLKNNPRLKEIQYEITYLKVS